MGRCGAPCTGAQSVADYALVADRAVDLLVGDTVTSSTRCGPDDPPRRRKRFEDARVVRERLVALVQGTSRAAARPPLPASPSWSPPGARSRGWEAVCVRYGQLAAATTSPRGADPMPYIDALRASAEVVAAPLPPCTAATPEESEKVLRWLESPRGAHRRGRRRLDLPGRRCGRGAPSWSRSRRPGARSPGRRRALSRPHPPASLGR